MTQKEKDDLCDGRSFQNTLEQFQILDQHNQSPSLKRHRTNGSDFQYDLDHDFENSNEGFSKQTRNIKYESRNKYSRTDQSLTTNSRTYTNSNSNSNTIENRNVQQRRPTTIDISESNDQHHENPVVSNLKVEFNYWRLFQIFNYWIIEISTIQLYKDI